jgi:beta-N-acetylhexosaminidase
MVAACVEGFRDSGILCTLKHFPGHGDTDADSHYGEAKTEKTLQELQECELIPFQSGIDAGAQLIMIGHITVPNVEDESIPASLSHFFVTELLREQMGFEGLIITDSMQMQAIRDQYSSGEAAVRALEAGVDLILMPEDLTGAAEGIKAALESGELQEERIDESVRRILTAKIESGIIE